MSENLKSKSKLFTRSWSVAPMGLFRKTNLNPKMSCKCAFKRRCSLPRTRCSIACLAPTWGGGPGPHSGPSDSGWAPQPCTACSWNPPAQRKHRTLATLCFQCRLWFITFPLEVVKELLLEEKPVARFSGGREPFCGHSIVGWGFGCGN